MNAYIFVIGVIDLLAAAPNENDKAQTNFAFENNDLIR